MSKPGHRAVTLPQPWPGGSVIWSITLCTKRLWVQPPVVVHMGGNQLMFLAHIDVSLSLLLSLFLLLSKINKYILKVKKSLYNSAQPKGSHWPGRRKWWLLSPTHTTLTATPAAQRSGDSPVWVPDLFFGWVASENTSTKSCQYKFALTLQHLTMSTMSDWGYSPGSH